MPPEYSETAAPAGNVTPEEPQLLHLTVVKDWLPFAVYVIGTVGADPALVAM